MHRLPAHRVVSAEEAVRHVRNGHRVYVGSACAEPIHLVGALQRNYASYADVELLHLYANSEPMLLDDPYTGHFRYNCFCVGDAMAPMLSSCKVDVTPMHLSELPRLLRKRLYPIDVALISVTPPDARGEVCLGLSVDVAHEAVAGARTVIAQVNDQLPLTHGRTRVPVDRIDWFVEGSHPPIEVAPLHPDPAAAAIGRQAAELVEDGDVLHVSYDPLAYAVLPFLAERRDLGLHTDIFTDALADLVQQGVITNRTKQRHTGKSVASLVVGTRDLFRFVHENPSVALLPTAEVHDRGLIGSHRRMVAFRAAVQADVTGNVLFHSHRSPVGRGVGGEVDFLRGAAVSRRGFPVILLRAGTREESSILSQFERWDGAMFTRSSVHYVCTEYGFAHLHGKTLRERVLAMIAIAHPEHRERLMAEAKDLGYVPRDQMVTPYPGCLYPNEQVTRHTFKDGLQVFFRPVHPSDERALQRLFYSHSPDTVRNRYHAAIKTMPHAKVQQLTNIDYRRDVAIVGLTGERGDREIICVGRCMYYPGRCGEVDITIGDAYQRRGLGTWLLDYVTHLARERGLVRLSAEILLSNRSALTLFRRAWPGLRSEMEGGTFTFTFDLVPGADCSGADPFDLPAGETG